MLFATHLLSGRVSRRAVYGFSLSFTRNRWPFLMVEGSTLSKFSVPTLPTKLKYTLNRQPGNVADKQQHTPTR
jgi:hypothetical protein